MSQYGYKDDFEEEDQEYLLFYNEESNNFFYQCLMQQVNGSSQNQSKLPQNKKYLKNESKQKTLETTYSKNIRNTSIQLTDSTNHSLNMDQEINSYIQTTHDSIQIHDEIKSEEVSSTSFNNVQCTDVFLQSKRIKRKYERRNQSGSNDIINNKQKLLTIQTKSNNRELIRKRAQRNRKGKHTQSKTQMFIYFMTQYHYSKNFNQFFRKKIIEKVKDLSIYQSLSSFDKVEIINKIILELQEYQMAMHYSVLKGLFLQKFSSQQTALIKAFFHEIIRQTYRIKLEFEKKNLLNNGNLSNLNHRKFFDEKGQQEFESIFEQTLKKEPYLSQMQSSFFDCIFEQLQNPQ